MLSNRIEQPSSRFELKRSNRLIPPNRVEASCTARDRNGDGRYKRGKRNDLEIRTHDRPGLGILDRRTFRGTLPLDTAIRRPELYKTALEVSDQIVQRLKTRREQNESFASTSEWAFRVLNINALLREMLASKDGKPPKPGVSPIASWETTTFDTPEERSSNPPKASWVNNSTSLRRLPGRSKNFLFFDVPLSGDFQIDCELSGTGADQVRLAYAGVSAFLVDGKTAEIRRISGESRKVLLKEPFDKIPEWVGYSIEVKDKRMTIKIAGKEVASEVLGAGSGPWLSLYQEAQGSGAVRNLRLKGDPKIPTSIEISAGSELPNWYSLTKDGAPFGSSSISTYNYDPNANHPEWSKRGVEIQGDGPLGAAGEGDEDNAQQFGFDFMQSQASDEVKIKDADLESALAYNRPMLENSSIEYEFLFEKGKIEVHPLIGEEAYLIDPDGVKVHTLSFGGRSESNLPPGNVRTVKEDRRGEGPLPLIDQKWNKLKISRNNGKLALELNGKLVYETALKTKSSLPFALFHYTDKTQARVRKVVYQGAWPQTIAEGDLLDLAKP